VVAARGWQVLLLGGAAGTGKTTVGHRLAAHFGIGLTQVDDFQVLLERMTTPEQQPALHFWRTHPDPGSLSAEEIFEQGLEVRRVMAVGLEAVIANHLESNTPVVLEGDFIDPALAARETFEGESNGGRVRSIFVWESDEQELVVNFSAREPDMPAQLGRARVSWLHGEWLRTECERHGQPVVESRPWATLFERVLAALS
jgi:2-phosphoglycerate kinase